MNATLLLKVKEQILAEPNKFFMSSWVHSLPLIENRVMHEGCGTAACIGGWACLLSNTEVHYGKYDEAASAALGIERQTCGTLFATSKWPEDLQMRWNAAKTAREQAEIAAERIDRYVDDFCPNFRRAYEEEKRNQQDVAA